MYFTRAPKRGDLEGGRTFAHGVTRLNLSASDLSTFVDPPDAALMFGFKAFEPGDGFDKAFAVWMVTLRRRGGDDAISESLQRIFPQLADEESLVRTLCALVDHSRTLGYQKLWLAPGLFKEPLLGPALKRVAEYTKKPVAVVPTSGMAALQL